MEGSKGHVILNKRIATMQQHLHRAMRPDSVRMMESLLGKDTEMETAMSLAAPETCSACHKLFAEARTELRRAYGTIMTLISKSGA
jgi:hypothetical protein